MEHITFLQLAEKVLAMVRCPMSPSKIWADAVGFGWDKLVATKGKTPAATLGAQLYSHVKRNGPTFAKEPGRKGGFYLKPKDAAVALQFPTDIDRMDESSFYKPFAEWLVKMKECTKAISLGGSRFGGKWGTPDVLGKREALRSHIIKGSTEIVSAEVKVDSNQLITAFGQACSYKLFSHKSYLVVPKSSGADDISKLDALCQIFGIGLVLFDSTSTSQPDFEIRVRPSRHEPDMFHMNRCMKEVESELFG
jgi:hypothetical protein